MAGINTLSFRVSNFGQASGNPSGLRVELGGTAAAAVPEPLVWTMLIIGFGLVGAGMRRSRTVVA